MKGSCQVITDVSITSDNKYIVSASGNQVIEIWSVNKRVRLGALKCLYLTSKQLITLDNEYIVSSANEVLVIWNLKKLKEKMRLKGHTSKIMSLSSTIDNRYIISGSFDMTVRVWKVMTRTKTYF